MTVDDKVENIEFKWGKKKGKGGKNKAVQFYESFTYDGVEYSLFDSVYVYKEGEEEPYIGKLLKIWETPDKAKKVKILWFFRPCEILNFLPTNDIGDNELFLASGEGLGLTNINPLEALVGKCNVICISKDSRNPQPPDEEVQKAEYVFYRVFDVGQHKVSDKLNDQIAEIDVKFLLNKLDSLKPTVKESRIDKKEVSGKDMERNEVVVPPSQENIQSMTGKENGKFVETLVAKHIESKPSLGEKPTSNVGLGEACKSNNGFSPTIDDKSMPMVKANGHEDNASLAKQKSSNEKQSTLREGLEQQLAEGYDRSQKIFGEKTALGSKIDEVGGKCAANGGSDKDEDVKGDGNFTHDTNGLVLDEHGKKVKLGDSKRNFNAKRGDGVQCRRFVHADDDDDNVETLGLDVISSKDQYKLRREKDSSDAEGTPSKRLKPHNKPTKLSHVLHKDSSTESPNGEQKIDSRGCEVTRRLDVDGSKLFKGFTWEDRMKLAHERGTLVLLQNLDPSLTSQEVEDLVQLAFQENCTAKIIPTTAFSSPHSGQAFVIFRRREAAEQAVRKLNQSCLLMSNQRPLVGSFAKPCFPEKKTKFYGHIVIDQLRIQMQREMKDAVSTSHCAKSNNVEFDMAMDWCLLQERTDYAWRKLFRRQGEELRKIKAKLKAK